MTADEGPVIDTINQFCVYGVATDYAGMLELIRYRAAELQTTNLEIDAVSGLHSGYSGKILAPTPIKAMGKVSMGPMLQTLGLALIVVRDDAAFAKVKDRLAKRARPHKPPNAGSVKPIWLFRKKRAREMGKKRFALMSPEQLKRHQQKAGRASGLARRRARRERERGGV